MHDNGEFIRHEECPHCGSSDANALYSTGKHYCFSCQVITYPDNDEGVIAVTTQKSNFAFLPIEVQALNKRKITEKTAKHWQYGVSTYNGNKVQVANYYDRSGTLQAQKVRFPNKDFLALGDMKKIGLYGEHLCRDGGKMITIVEGELDALSLSQVFDNKWSVVSVPSGADSAKKAISKSLEWLCNYESIVIMFDNDEHGQQAAKEVANILPPSKAKIAKLPLKDASDSFKQEDRLNLLMQSGKLRPTDLMVL